MHYYNMVFFSTLAAFLFPCLFLFTIALLVFVYSCLACCLLLPCLLLFTLALLVLLPLFMIHGVSSLMNNIIHTLGFVFVCVLCRWQMVHMGGESWCTTKDL